MKGIKALEEDASTSTVVVAAVLALPDMESVDNVPLCAAAHIGGDYNAFTIGTILIPDQFSRVIKLACNGRTTLIDRRALGALCAGVFEPQDMAKHVMWKIASHGGER